ncbi:hypothetical protein K437DRAFT_256208 [Tilletiaria anomala UBC 951]|uniref:Exonuclease domain-containing protein n=1 Tax=Tilletiaria anomala (strain ATCC 24038 / CBS 436.72 / UBC 951) TaxID=1037660 RepID=A0A066W1Q8_TILAU|nr:uncharacterized protein K437DRAFT_256208 [Tilletiaria anomala UBC 951]KDN46483.1 hypothetical protein K437DRAFT_256208 [Tilletiaria anomala UBC 951]
MFKTQGKLSDIVCPAHRDGVCEPSRAACPFSHDLSAVQPCMSDVSVKGSLAITEPEEHGGSRVLGKRAISVPASSSEPPKKSRKEHQQMNDNMQVSMRKAQSAESSTMALAPKLLSKDHPRSSKIPLTARQAILKAFYNGFCGLYSPLLKSPDPELSAAGRDLAHKHALAQELETFKASNEHSYKNSSRSALVGINGRDKDTIKKAAADSLDEKARTGSFSQQNLEECKETGTQADVGRKRTQCVQKEKGKLTLQKFRDKLFVCPVGALEIWGYTTHIPEEWGPGGEAPDSIGQERQCDRCGVTFKIESPPDKHVASSDSYDTVCRFHHGRKRPEKLAGKGRNLVWTCCGAKVLESKQLNEETACSSSCTHVFRLESARQLHAQTPFFESHASLPSKEAKPDAHDILALDCELCFTTAGMSLTQLSVVSAEGTTLMDIKVKPNVAIIDYNTRFSGLTEKDFAEGSDTCDLVQARGRLLQLMHKDTILVGHSLENDLKALRLVHLNIVDTVTLFPHPRGPPYRMSLRELTSNHLGRIIQSSGAEGHTASVDAQMALELARWKIVNEPASSPFRNVHSKWYGGGQKEPPLAKEKEETPAGTPSVTVSAKSLAAIAVPKRR